MQQETESQGHQSAALYDRYAADVFTYIYKRVFSIADTEDILLDTFVAALKANNLFELTETEQLAWFRRVAHNKIVDRYRHQARFPTIPLNQIEEIPEHTLIPEEYILQKERSELLRRSIEQLSSSEQLMVQLRYGNGLRLTEIATLLKKPEGTVRKNLFRILRRLRAVYEQQEGENR